MESRRQCGSKGGLEARGFGGFPALSPVLCPSKGEQELRGSARAGRSTGAAARADGSGQGGRVCTERRRCGGPFLSGRTASGAVFLPMWH